MSRRRRYNVNEPKERDRLLFIGRCEEEVIIEPPSPSGGDELVVGNNHRDNTEGAQGDLGPTECENCIWVGRVKLDDCDRAIAGQVSRYASIILDDPQLNDLVDSLEELDIYAFRRHLSPSGRVFSKQLLSSQNPKIAVSAKARTAHWRLQALMGLSQNKGQLQIYFEALESLGAKKRSGKLQAVRFPLFIDRDLEARIKQRFEGRVEASIRLMLSNYFKERDKNE